MVDERLSPAKIKARDISAKDSRAPLLNGERPCNWKYMVIVRYLCLWIALPELGLSCVGPGTTKSVGHNDQHWELSMLLVLMMILTKPDG